MLWVLWMKALLVWLLSVFLMGCASLPSDYPRQSSYALETGSTDDSRIGQWVRTEVDSHPGVSGFYPLADGLDALVARLALIDSAEQSIDAQYYLFHDDLAGQLFLRHLLLAAQRGVRVRLLLDDLAVTSIDKALAIANQHPLFEVRLFNPVASRGIMRPLQMVAHFDRINRRMHNKSFIVDNQVAILGGRNIGNEYYRNSPVEFADLDMVQLGKVVPEISRDFDRYWNSELSYPAEVVIPRQVTSEDQVWLQESLDRAANSEAATVYLERLKKAPVIRKMAAGGIYWHWGNALVYSDATEKVLTPLSDRSTHLTPQLRPYIDGTTRELIIFTPYFVPGKEGVAFFTDLVKRGVNVVVITNSLASTDVAVVHAGYSKYREDLLAGGVRLIEVKPTVAETHLSITGSSRASLHAKTYIIDRRYLFVGSLNLDPRSALLNTEMGVVYDSPAFAEDFFAVVRKLDAGKVWELRLKDNRVQWFDCSTRCVAVSSTDPGSSIFTRTGIFLLSLLPIEQQL